MIIKKTYVMESFWTEPNIIMSVCFKSTDDFSLLNSYYVVIIT